MNVRGLRVLSMLVFLSVQGAAVFASPAEGADPFFVTIQKVELKSVSGEWVTVLEPDKKVDLAQEDPSVSFFNNGRVPPGRYVNVRVLLDQGEITRREDYTPAMEIRRGSFVNVLFGFDLSQAQQKKLSKDHFKHIQVTVDETERLDGADQIEIGG